MAILPIIEVPHPLLSKRARVVEEDEFGAALVAHLSDMAETMYAAPGVGLAAPQVGDSRRILVADPGFEDEDGEEHKGAEFVAMVNPSIVERSRELIMWDESCLSVPDYSVDIKRNKVILVEFRDGLGELQSQQFSEFSAVVIQHEIDHLDGKTLLEHSSRLKKSRYLKRRRKPFG